MGFFHFHHWEHPLYNKGLDLREQLLKCQCGAVKSKKKYIPLPDTEEYLEYQKNKDATNFNVEETESSNTFIKPFIKPLNIIFLVVFIVITITVMIPSVEKLALNIGNSTSDAPSFISPLFFIFPILIIAVFIISMFRYHVE